MNDDTTTVTANQALAQITAAQQALVAIFSEQWSDELRQKAQTGLADGTHRYLYEYRTAPYSFVAYLEHVETGERTELFRADGDHQGLN